MLRQSLFDISSEYLNALQEYEQYLVENEGDITDIPDTILERLNINENELSMKIADYQHFIDSLRGEIDGIRSTVERLERRIQSKRNLVDILKTRITEAVKQFGTVKKGSKSKSIETEFCKASFINTNPVVVEDVTSEVLLPYISHEVKLVLSPENLDLLRQLGKLLPEHHSIASILEEVPSKIKLDKKAVKEVLKSGEKLKGVYLDEEAGYLKIT